MPKPPDLLLECDRMGARLGLSDFSEMDWSSNTTIPKWRLKMTKNSLHNKMPGSQAGTQSQERSFL